MKSTSEYWERKYRQEKRDRIFYQEALEKANDRIVEIREKIEGLIEEFKK